MRRICPKCKGTVMDDKALYCPICNWYLRTKAGAAQTKMTIWETDAKKRTQNASMQWEKKQDNPNTNEGKWYIICRNCGERNVLEDRKVLPLACAYCSENFDSFQDIPQCETTGISDHNNTGHPSCITPQQPIYAGKSAPMRTRTKPEMSQLRLRSLNISGELILSDQQTNILGINGNLQPSFFHLFHGIASAHCAIEHDASGWYIRFLNNNSQYNGAWVDLNDQMLMKNGDIITLGNDCILQVVIDIIRGGAKA